jgi:hypothetical protein
MRHICMPSQHTDVACQVLSCTVACDQGAAQPFICILGKHNNVAHCIAWQRVQSWEVACHTEYSIAGSSHVPFLLPLVQCGTSQGDVCSLLGGAACCLQLTAAQAKVMCVAYCWPVAGVSSTLLSNADSPARLAPQTCTACCPLPNAAQAKVLRCPNAGLLGVYCLLPLA